MNDTRSQHVIEQDKIQDQMIEDIPDYKLRKQIEWETEQARATAEKMAAGTFKPCRKQRRADMVKQKRLFRGIPEIKDDRVKRIVMLNTPGYEIALPDGMRQMICGKDSYPRALKKLRELDGKDKIESCDTSSSQP